MSSVVPGTGDRAVLSAWVPKTLADDMARHALANDSGISREVRLAVREHLERARHHKDDRKELAALTPNERPAATGLSPNTDNGKPSTARRQNTRMLTICRRCGAANFDTLKNGHAWFTAHLANEHGVRPVATQTLARLRFERHMHRLERYHADRTQKAA